MPPSTEIRETSDGLPADLAEAFGRLDDILRDALSVTERWYGVTPGEDGFRGLYLDRSDIERDVARPPGSWHADGRADRMTAGPWPSRLFALHDGEPSRSRLGWLAATYRLTALETDALVLALAPEIDTRYERAFAFLQDDVTRRRPTIELTLRLLCRSPGERLEGRSSFEADAPLMQHRLLRSDATDHGSSLASALSVDPQIILMLLGVPRLDRRLAGVLSSSERGTGELDLVPAPFRAQLDRAAFAVATGARQALRVLLAGPAGSGKHSVADGLAGRAGQQLLVLDVGRLSQNRPDLDAFQECVQLAFREAWFRGAALYAHGVEAGAAPAAAARRGVLLAEARRHLGLVVFASEATWHAPHGLLPGLVSVDLGPPDATMRLQLWEAAAAGAGITPPPQLSAQLAERFALTAGQIVDAVGAAALVLDTPGAAGSRTRRRARIPNDGGLRTALFAAARGQCGHALEQYATRVSPVQRWDDLIVPRDAVEQLRELCARAAARRTVLDDWGFGERLSRGRGVTALFTGGSGTGKTMAAEVVAGVLGADLFIIDLAGVISKYIGETEQNLDRVFRAAQYANGVLFFDEADALFGKRSEVRDAHDRYANIEISYLLQRMEQYEGIAILATNLRENLDEAFVRRLAFCVHFPYPDADSRRRIWQGVWPPAAPVASDLDFSMIAARIQLSGGGIHNVAIAAAHLAAEAGETIGLSHIVRGIRREFQKIGRNVDDAELLATLEADASAAIGNGAHV